MIKILIVSPASYTAGGKARFTQMLYDALKANKKVKVYLLNTTRTKTARRYNNINIFGYKHVLYSGIKRNLEIIINSILFKVKFLFCLLFFKPDFVQVHTSSFFDFWDNSIYIIISKLFYFQTILRVGDGAFDTFYLNSNKLAKKIFKKIISMVDKLVVQTVYWKKFIEKNNLKKNKIIIIPNFVDLKYWSKIKERTFAKNKEFKIVFLTGIDEKVKGYYDLMPAFSELSEKINIKLTIAGLSKKVEDEYKMLIEKKKLIVLDYISGDEKLNVFQNANVFILPTLAYEGFGLIILASRIDKQKTHDFLL